MKVLFVFSGNNNDGISPIIKNQAESLKDENLDIQFFGIKGKGYLGYLKNIVRLRKHFKKNKYDIIHAHYSLSALAITLAYPPSPVVVSLMGSDIKMAFLWKKLIVFSARFLWSAVIVKSQKMKDGLKIKNAFIIPNGVDLNKFFPIVSEQAKKLTGFENHKKNIVFIANPDRYEKNFVLVKSAFEKLKADTVLLHVIFNKQHTEIVNYLSAADLLVLSSLWEGSPNIIKEAMSCNLPIVSTDVGDVKWLFGDLEGHYLASFDPAAFAEKIKMALVFKGKTRGRERLIELGLDAESVARRITEVYKSVLKRKN